MPMHSITFRISNQDKRDLDYILAEMQAATSVDLRQSDILRMLIREGAQKRRSYGPHLLEDIVCKRDENRRAIVIGVNQDWVLRSPTGFEWGYGGAGPSDLALNILLTATGDRKFAFRHHERFRNETVGRIPEAGGELRASEVLNWVSRFRDLDQIKDSTARREDANTMCL